MRYAVWSDNEEKFITRDERYRSKAEQDLEDLIHYGEDPEGLWVAALCPHHVDEAQPRYGCAYRHETW